MDCGVEAEAKLTLPSHAGFSQGVYHSNRKETKIAGFTKTLGEWLPLGKTGENASNVLATSF